MQGWLPLSLAEWLFRQPVVFLLLKCLFFLSCLSYNFLKSSLNPQSIDLISDKPEALLDAPSFRGYVHLVVCWPHLRVRPNLLCFSEEAWGLSQTPPTLVESRQPFSIWLVAGSTTLPYSLLHMCRFQRFPLRIETC